MLYLYSTRGIMKCPKKHVKENFVMWWHFLNFLKSPKIEEFHFRFIFCFKIDHVLIFWNAPFFLSDSEIGKMHMINFKIENEPKMKFFDFGAFQKIEKMLSHDKILFHMLFGAFHDTSCILEMQKALGCPYNVIITWWAKNRKGYSSIQP